MPEEPQARPPEVSRRRGSSRAPGRRLPADFGAYELFDHIGRGGMADIYRARHRTDLDGVRQVVIKELLPELSRKERMVELLAEEAKLASQLDHTNVVRVEELACEEGALYIAMEWVSGLDLRELLRGCSRQRVELPLALSLFIVGEVLRALEYAHHAEVVGAEGVMRTGIIHRDVSPSNVLLSFEGEVKLCDFGIARVHDEAGEGVTDPAMIEGKAGYMSPEQARGCALDPRADLFSAAVILWELLSGRRFYKATESASLLEIAAGGGPRALAVSDYPAQERLDEILAKALAADPANRFQSAGEMLDSLQLYAADNGLTGHSRALQRFLGEHFAEGMLRAQRRRELATEALARGPVAVLSVLDVPVVGLVNEFEPGGRAIEQAVLGLPAPGVPAKGRTVFAKLFLALLVAGMVGFLLLRAFSS